MHLPRLWTDAPVAKSKSRGEQQSRGSRGSTKAQKRHKQRKGRKGRTSKNTTGQKDQAATKGGGAGKAEEDRAEKAAHITLE